MSARVTSIVIMSDSQAPQSDSHPSISKSMGAMSLQCVFRGNMSSMVSMFQWIDVSMFDWLDVSMFQCLDGALKTCWIGWGKGTSVLSPQRALTRCGKQVYKSCQCSCSGSCGIGYFKWDSNSATNRFFKMCWWMLHWVWLVHGCLRCISGSEERVGRPGCHGAGGLGGSPKLWRKRYLGVWLHVGFHVWFYAVAEAKGKMWCQARSSAATPMTRLS